MPTDRQRLIVGGWTMAYPADFGRTFVLKARRDTILLVAAAVGATFAMSSAIHSHNAPIGASPVPEDQQAWAGGLADVTAATAGAHELVTSASLVVPSADLALPRVAIRPLVKLHGCDGAACTTRLAAPGPVRRPVGTAPSPTLTASLGPAPHAPTKRIKPSLMSRLNPFNHLPDMTNIRRPFTVAGDTVSSWFRF